MRRSPGPEEVEGAVVEPVQPRHFLSPFLSFFEPPPLYSENSDATCGAVQPGPRFEPPPPYTVDDRDTAGLILNESSENRYPGPPPGDPAEPRPQNDREPGEPARRPVQVAIATEAVQNVNNEIMENLHCNHSSTGAVSNSTSNTQHCKNSVETPARVHSRGRRSHARDSSRFLSQPTGRMRTPPGEEEETDILTQEESET